MALKRMIVELGMGTDLTGADYTKAAIRALKDALWHNSLTIANAIGLSPHDMHVKVLVGVPKPHLLTRPPSQRRCPMENQPSKSSRAVSKS